MQRQGVEGHHKSSPSDLVTAADTAVEAMVATSLGHERPGDGLLGEEGAAAEGTTGRTWVIDPVDGTYNFVHGLTWWCSALALADGDEVALGAIHHPHDDQLWVGGRGVATTRNGRQVAGVANRELADCSITTYLHPSYFGVLDVLGPFSVVAARAKAIRMGGSGSMDLAAVADGRIDRWCQHSVPTWDWMPGHAVVEGAGGHTAHVSARGITWSLAGAPAAVRKRWNCWGQPDLSMTSAADEPAPARSACPSATGATLSAARCHRIPDRYCLDMPRLIHLNGPPGIGKSTIARRYVDEHHGVLNCDVDVLRTLIGGWSHDFAAAGALVRPAALAMIEAYLENGHDVVFPQMLINPSELARFQSCADRAGAQFVERFLMDDAESAVARFSRRGASTPDDPWHSQVRAIVAAQGGDDALARYHSELGHLLAGRPDAEIIWSVEGKVGDTYEGLIESLA